MFFHIFPYFSTCFPIVFHRVFPPAAGRPGGRRRLVVFGAEAAGRCGRGAEVFRVRFGNVDEDLKLEI